MAEKVEAFLVAYSSQERANSAPEFRNCALGGLSEERFEFAENLLDRVEIRRIRWQIERGRTHSLDRVRHTGYLMSRKVVHDDDVTVVERWSQTLFDVCEEVVPFIGPSITNGATIPSWRSPTTRVMVFQWPWGTDPTNRSPRGQRPRSLTKLVLVAVSSMNTNLAGSSRPCLRIQRCRARATSARSCSVARRLFLTVTLCRSKNRQTAVRLPGIRCLRIATTISSKVRSGCSATRANSHSTCPSNGDVLPPLSFALAFPVSYQRCNHLTAELALRLKLSAASRRDAPATTASITRSRKSAE